MDSFRAPGPEEGRLQEMADLWFSYRLQGKQLALAGVLAHAKMDHTSLHTREAEWVEPQRHEYPLRLWPPGMC